MKTRKGILCKCRSISYPRFVYFFVPSDNNSYSGEHVCLSLDNNVYSSLYKEGEGSFSPRYFEMYEDATVEEVEIFNSIKAGKKPAPLRGHEFLIL